MRLKDPEASEREIWRGFAMNIQRVNDMNGFRVITAYPSNTGADHATKTAPSLFYRVHECRYAL